MELKVDRFLAYPLTEAVDFFEKQQINYSLKEIKPPLGNRDHIKKNGSKRVLKIIKERESYLITWSFQYNN